MTNGLILMIPVRILLLRPMDKWKCLAVVVCFGAAFYLCQWLVTVSFSISLILFYL
ncbi:hypothetical protein F4813DRAFT_371999 [Daldinia decipiens]|uniref:uncharacterized protein n=1 Tax=Daldinia decipiens TaxID=326647 RepID=UPI0020C30FFE|nr:uncharacterized protein F4813DRAFT_371999 [Daldinia decipiens]KAI1654059.1 hypothetical protein F4813DRAFT_371999 [Daldinia decipiens]